MSLEQSFRLSSLLLAAIGFVGLCLTGELPWMLIALGMLGLALPAVALVGVPTERYLADISRDTWHILNLAALAGFIIDLLWISQDLLPAGVHFLVLLLVSKLLTLRQRADYLQLYVVSLMSVLSAAAMTVELWYATVFIAYLLAAVWTLLLFHLRQEADEVRHLGAAASGRPAAIGLRIISARFFWVTNGVALSAFCLTVAIFFLMPRIGAGFFQKSRGEAMRTSGFSEHVDLGVIGAVKQDQSLVMRVEFPEVRGVLSERVYFRGTAFDRYDGHAWVNTRLHRRSLLRSDDGAFQASTEPLLAPTGLRQDILLESLDVPVLFGITGVELIKGEFPVVQMDALGSLYLPYAPSGRFQYTVYSSPGRLQREERTVASFHYPASITGPFLQLPNMAARVGDLAREVTARAGTPYEKVLAIEQHLRQHYQYSLDVGQAPPINPVEEFLFTRKTGYCEHYATAMVVMLRTLGIPARLVTGYLPGEWNEYGNYYVIRQRDAHAWVEVYFPRSGWVTFDPTPNVVAPPADPVWTRVGSALDSMRLKWDRVVIRYSFQDQLSVAQGIRQRGDSVRTEVATWVAMARYRYHDGLRRIQAWGKQAPWSVGAVALGGLAVLMAALTLARSLRLRLLVGAGGPDSAQRRAAHQREASRLYETMLHRLERAGIVKPQSAGPIEFSKRVAGLRTNASDSVIWLTDLYCRIRFGSDCLTAADLRRAEEQLQTLQTVLRT